MGDLADLHLRDVWICRDLVQELGQGGIFMGFCFNISMQQGQVTHGIRDVDLRKLAYLEKN